MAYKDILVHVDNTPHARVRLELAAKLAQAQDAHLIALNVRTRPVLPAFIVSQYGRQIDRIRETFNEEAAREARAAFDAIRPAHGVTTEWRDVDGGLVENVSLHARYADVTIIGQTESDEGERPLPDSLIMDVGRPVLVIPASGQFDTIGSRVIAAWNGSREATRAIHDALPLMKQAERVHVIAVNPTGGMAGHGAIPGADICLHLSRHGVNAVCEHIKSEDLNVGEMLLNRAADEDADLMVLGAYGRSRLREIMLGGATRHLLRHMTLPVLMSH